MIENILDNRTGQIIISIILGLGLSVIFSSACIGRNCYIIKGPNPNIIKDKVYQFDKIGTILYSLSVDWVGVLK
jgi:hypothetical protein